jgi:hypothetical protein
MLGIAPHPHFAAVLSICSALLFYSALRTRVQRMFAPFVKFVLQFQAGIVRFTERIERLFVGARRAYAAFAARTARFASALQCEPQRVE